MRLTPTSCPVLPDQHARDSDLEPLLEVLQRNSLPNEETQFPRGTLRPDGRLDLCKQQLGINGCERIVEALRTQNLVHTLLLGTNAIGDEGASRVADLIRQGQLGSVYLGCNLIGETGVEDIAEALETDKHVKALWLKRNPLGAAGIRRLAQMLRRNVTLRTLDVVNTSPDHGAMVELLEVIALHPSLEYVYLSGNGLDVEEAPALAGCLINPRLKGLYLSVNHLGDAGARVIAAALVENAKLEFLSLSSNGITDEGVIALCGAVQHHPSMLSLDLGYSPSTKVLGAHANRLTDRCVPALGDLLRHNTTLRDLNLHPNTFTAPSSLVLKAAASSTLHRLILDADRTGTAASATHLDARQIRSVYR